MSVVLVFGDHFWQDHAVIMLFVESANLTIYVFSSVTTSMLLTARSPVHSLTVRT
jgi:hypothetical protein